MIHVDAPTGYHAGLEEARRQLGVSTIRFLRDRADPAPPTTVGTVTVDLADLRRQWPLLLDGFDLTVQNLAGLAQANEAAARLLWQA